jgi:small subunit ribosomal protein S20
MIKSRLKTYSKKLEELVNSRSKEDAEVHLRRLSGMLDSAVSKGVFHKNTAARKKSKFHRLLSSID